MGVYPVSYTHLDVYKRQVYYHLPALRKIDIEAPYHALTNAGHISYVELDGDPVSYTHLDVYKRQDIAAPILRETVSRVVDGKVVTMYKDELEKVLYKD